MAEIIERDGKLYCVEDGYEWEYTPPSSQPDPEQSAQERIQQLESQNLMLMEAVADLYEMMLGAG